MLPDVLPYALERAIREGRVGRRLRLSDELTVFACSNEKASLVDEREYEFGFSDGDYAYSKLHFQLAGHEIDAGFYPDDADKLFERPASTFIERLEERAFQDLSSFREALAEHGIPYVYGLPLIAKHNIREACQRVLAGDHPVLGSYGKLTSLCLARGDRAEMEWVADLIFQLEPARVERALEGKSEDAGVQLILPIGKVARLIPGGDSNISGWFRLDHPRAELWEIWLRFFEPSVDEVVHSNDIEHGFKLFSSRFRPTTHHERYVETLGSYSPTELSQHERMEVALPLGQWLRERAALTDERIAELLG